ncbi:6-phosphogluconolactonase [Paraphysoderma sedebokerense]|nr:6-phosphogluconolactonase [Paraphysoderma sedebokerense]
MTKPTVYSFSDNSTLSRALDHFVASQSADAISKSGRFTIALSGGSLPALLSAVLKTNKSVDFSKWHVFFADERCVPLDHSDSNYLSAKKELLDHVKIPRSQVYTIHPDSSQNAAKAADDYTEQMKKVFKTEWPEFDLVLLGMGPDGHTCSLFPGHPLLSEKKKWTAHITDSPKPPPSRITLTFPVVNHAKVVAFVSTGAGKKDVLKEILESPDVKYPAQMVQPATGKLYWFVDDAAAQSVTKVEKHSYKL